MRLALRIAIALLLLPAAEVLVFLLVAWAIGFFPAFALVLLTSFAGGVVLRRVGRGGLAQVRGALGNRARPRDSPESGRLLVTLGGILLLLPGFITDILGAGLLLGPTRRWLGVALGQAFRGDQRQAGKTGPAVIDLEPGEWRAISDRKSPRRRR